jgi:putative oxidoreductase
MKANKDLGLLIIRVGIGLMFMIHGYPKLTGGSEMWTQIGSAMSNVGINFGHTVFGGLAAIAEFGGGLCILLGIFFRPALCMLVFTMIIAAAMHLSSGDGIMGASHAIESAIVFVGLYISGAGSYTLISRKNS